LKENNGNIMKELRVHQVEKYRTRLNSATRNRMNEWVDGWMEVNEGIQR
jgi:hypothetical protein